MKTSWFGAHTGAPLAVLVLGAWLVVTAAIRFAGADASSCPTSFSSDVWLTGGFTAVLAAFLLGGLLGSLPHHRPEKQVAGLATQFGITALVVIIAVALAYETRSLASPPPKLWPITHYLMCIKQQENDWTVMVFVLSALLVGRWLWHRPGSYLQ